MKTGKIRLSELGTKRAVSTKTGEDLGCIKDVSVDMGSGAVADVVIVRRRGIFGREEQVVSWQNVCLVGEDTVLVEVCREPLNGRGEGKKCFGLFE